MIAFQEALQLVLNHSMELAHEKVAILESTHRILAEEISADRNFPPFDRVTKDGIAICFDAFENGCKKFKIQEIAAAGQPQKVLFDTTKCIEVMTGAMLPQGADTVIMYEHLHIENGFVEIIKAPTKGQDIHYQGADEQYGNVLLNSGARIETAEIGVLATVGKSEVLVKRLPKVAIVSTGDELVAITETPKPHQIRRSNSFSLQAALRQEGIQAETFHFNDETAELEKGLQTLLDQFDVLLLSGGVSMGKFDFLPQVLQKLGVEKLFHKVKQRPGKPFWFGKHKESEKTIFAFPGNPVSTFANFHVYFLSWLNKSLGLKTEIPQAVLGESFENKTELTLFMLGNLHLHKGALTINLVKNNGSGDLSSLCQANVLVQIEPKTRVEKGELLPFHPTKRLF